MVRWRVGDSDRDPFSCKPISDAQQEIPLHGPYDAGGAWEEHRAGEWMAGGMQIGRLRHTAADKQRNPLLLRLDTSRQAEAQD